MGVPLLLYLLALTRPWAAFASQPSSPTFPSSLEASEAPSWPPGPHGGPPEQPTASLPSIRAPGEKWSWSRSMAPRLTDGQGPASIPAKALKTRRTAKRAGSILSATAVAFSDTWRAGVNKQWYAFRGWGWRHPDNWKERTYICVYSMDGRPCGPVDTGTGMWPAGLHCLSNQCCSQVHISLFFSRNVCTANAMLCAFRHESHSYGKCKCNADSCPGDSVCVEEHHEHGGVYCKCKEGMVGDGKECYEDKCPTIDCSPGRCVQTKTDVTCECPTGYEAAGTTCEQIPMCSRGIQDICGPPERVLECVNVGRTNYTCVCAPGYAVVNTASGKQCDLASNTLFCAGGACGEHGVQKCEDLPAGGVKCICKDGYLLERTDDGKKFRCSPIDPCKMKPCGSETVAKACTRTPNGSYHCECQKTAELVQGTGTEGPSCRHIEESVNILPYITVAGGGFLLVGLGVGVWWFAFKSGSNRPRDYDFTHEAFAGVGQ